MIFLKGIGKTYLEKKKLRKTKQGCGNGSITKFKIIIFLFLIFYFLFSIIFKFLVPPFPSPCFDFLIFFYEKFVLLRPIRKYIFGCDYRKNLNWPKKICILYYAYFFKFWKKTLFFHNPHQLCFFWKVLTKQT